MFGPLNIFFHKAKTFPKVGSIWLLKAMWPWPRLISTAMSINWEISLFLDITAAWAIKASQIKETVWTTKANLARVEAGIDEEPDWGVLWECGYQENEAR